MLNKCLKNVGLKEHQIINLPEAPTCFGTALDQISKLDKACFLVSFSTTVAILDVLNPGITILLTNVIH
jgi:hypothetical protein